VEEEREKSAGARRQSVVTHITHPVALAPQSPRSPIPPLSAEPRPAPPMDHHLTPTPPPPPPPMGNSAAGASSKPPTPASTPNSRLASAPSSRHAATPPHASAAASAPAPASRTVYSDRFIPSRTGSNLALFDLAPSPSPAASSSHSHDAGPAASSGSAQPAASPYCTLLRAALFGPDTPDRVASSAAACSSSSSSFSPGPSPVGTPATGNIFRFKTEVRRNAKRALFSGDQEEDALFPGIFTTRGAGPRKVPRSPYKVRWGIGFGAFLIGPSLFLDLGFLGSGS
jgi:cell division cycle 20-like protein 1, cofactor of APC complex